MTEQPSAKTLRRDLRGAGDGERNFHALDVRVIDVGAEIRIVGVAKTLSLWERREKTV